ncbi:hypothetical protein IFM89_035556 [Coptis chinensis]|uniref:Uncharacterized protein n=1 Tax=Coptis chinensis TaxID=261450 RepID=A0A835LTC3_9MAGN|nr:hypothetical protein IFM89_035556 [Coptis chinensis]
MKFLGWYVKIGLISAMIGASMEFFMVKTGFSSFPTARTCHCFIEKLKKGHSFDNEMSKGERNARTNPQSPNILCCADDKVTVLESEKRAWENSAEAQAIRDALNPWRNLDTEKKNS